MILHMNDSAYLTFLSELYDFTCSGEEVAESLITSNCIYEITGDSDVLMEGASDIIDTILSSIRKLLRAIRDFFANIIRAILAISMDYRKYVKTYKNELENANPRFTFKGYTFAGLFASAPSMEEFEKAINAYNTMISEPNPDEMKAHRNEIKSWLEESHVEEVRAKVLGIRGTIEQEQFSDKVRAYYRGCEGGEVVKEDILIDSTYVRKLVSDVENVYRLKDKADKDRKNISAMLAKTEDFFSKKAATVYRGANKRIAAHKIDYARSGQKVSFSDNELTYTDKVDDAITKLINAMYSQVRVLSGIINVCISERAIGFQDYIKQCRVILGEAITGKDDQSNGDKVATEGYEMLDGSALEESTNYATLCEQVRLIESRFSGIPEIQYQIQEAHRAVMLYENGMLPEPVMEGVIGNLIDGVKNFISNLTDMFRKKQVENIQKYQGWYENPEVVDSVIAQCANKEYTALPLWEGIWGSNAISEITQLINSAKQEPSNPASADFAKKISGHNTIAELKDDKKKVTKILNHYRTGKSEDYVEPVKIGGTKLSTQVKAMFTFMGDYSSISSAAQQLKSKVDQLEPPAEDKKTSKSTASTVTDGYEYYLQLAGVVMEASPADDPKNATKTINATGNKEHQMAATQIRETSKKNNASDESTSTNAAENKGSANATTTDYYKQLYPYIQQTISSYLTTLEERYTLYWKLLTSIAPDDFKPIFKDGVYQGTKKTGLMDKVKNVTEKVRKRQDATRISGGTTNKK